MNIAGVLLLRFIGSLEHSAAAQAAYAVGYTELFSLITWTSVGLMGASATIAGQNLGAGDPERARHGVAVAAGIGLGVAAIVGLLFLTIPDLLLGIFGMKDPLVTSLGQQLLRFLCVSGLFVTVALATRADSRARATRRARSTSRSSRRSSCRSGSVLSSRRRAACTRPTSGSRSCSGT